MSSSAVVLGARNLGGAVATHLLSAGWQVGSVARSDDSLAAVRSAGALGVNADAADPGALGAALDEAARSHDGIDLIVNAVTAARPTGGPWGGGPIADASPDAFDGWTAAVGGQAFTFLSVGTAALRVQGRGGTLVQVDPLAVQEEIARAVAYLAGQESTGFTHELVVTPAGERWVP
jgi:NAD(P)-dependent dehydrogenase (short-subunit alcohol dehydrogenase family)